MTEATNKSKRREQLATQLQFIRDQNKLKEPYEQSFTKFFEQSLLRAVQDFEELSSAEGFSGAAVEMLAPAIAKTFEKAMLGRCIHQIEDVPEKWTLLNYGDSIKYQHRDDSRFFKQADGRVTVNCITFQEPSGSAYSGNTEGVGKTFCKLPVSHKQFYVDVVSWEPKRNWWEHRLTNPNQLDAVAEHYGVPIEKPYVFMRGLRNWFRAKQHRIQQPDRYSRET